MKWILPSFVHEGRILCGMAAFKEHCTFDPPETARDVHRVAHRGEVQELEIRELLNSVTPSWLPPVRTATRS